MAAPDLKLSPHFFISSHAKSRATLPCQLSAVQSSPMIRTLSVACRTAKLRPPSGIKDQDSLSSMITELEIDQQEEEQEERFWVPKPVQPQERLVDRWSEIHGCHDWAGLLDPMDPLLRSELIRYGEFVQACYDAFDYDPFFRYCGSCKYNRRKFFERLGMDSVGHEVTRYLYATSNINLPNFFSKTKGGVPDLEPARQLDRLHRRVRQRDIVII